MNAMCGPSVIGNALRDVFTLKQIGQALGIGFIQHVPFLKMPGFYQPHVDPAVVGNPMEPHEIALYKTICEGLDIGVEGAKNKGNNLKPWITAMVKAGLDWGKLNAYTFPSLPAVTENIKSKVGDNDGTTLFVNVVVKMAHMMYGDVFINKVFNHGDMKGWIEIGPLVPKPQNSDLVQAFLDDTPALWDLMAVTWTMEKAKVRAPVAQALVREGTRKLDALLMRTSAKSQLC